MELLNSKQAADRLHISKRTVEDWRVRGAGPRFLKVGRRVFYTPAAIDDWLNDRVRTSTSEVAA